LEKNQDENNWKKYHEKFDLKSNYLNQIILLDHTCVYPNYLAKIVSIDINNFNFPIVVNVLGINKRINISVIQLITMLELNKI